MKKILKRISVVLCTLALTIGFVGSKPLEADAWSPKVSISAELKDLTGVASKSKTYKVYIKFANETKERYLGQATYSVLSNSYKLKKTSTTVKLSKDTTAKVVIEGPNARGNTQRWGTSSVTIKNNALSKSFKVTGTVSSPKIK